MKILSIESSELAHAICSGDPELRNKAYKMLYMSPKVNGKIRDWAKFYNLRDKEPDDILQEGLILLDELILSGRFRTESRVETFLLGICKNLIRDSIKKVQRIVFKEAIPDSAFNSEDTVADYLELSEQTASERDLDSLLHTAMKQLAPNCQDALRMYYFEQKSMQEVALERALANAEQAKKAVHRCRERLRELIKGNEALQIFLN